MTMFEPVDPSPLTEIEMAKQKRKRVELDEDDGYRSGEEATVKTKRRRKPPTDVLAEPLDTPKPVISAEGDDQLMLGRPLEQGLRSSKVASSEMLERRYLCLTICGYRKAGMSEQAYRDHMVNVSAPMTKELMIKYGVKRWTQIHNQSATRALMSHLFDHQMANVADFDCFSQVIFENVEDYKRMKQDPWYKQHLVNDHENFADTKRSL